MRTIDYCKDFSNISYWIKRKYKDENIDSEKIKLEIKYEKKIQMYVTSISKK